MRLCALYSLALLWQILFVGFCDRHFTVRAAQGRRPCEEIEDGLPDGWNAGSWRRSCDSFFPSRRFEAAGLEEGVRNHRHQGVSM
jgi:hypothetical protein